MNRVDVIRYQTDPAKAQTPKNARRSKEGTPTATSGSAAATSSATPHSTTQQHHQHDNAATGQQQDIAIFSGDQDASMTAYTKKKSRNDSFSAKRQSGEVVDGGGAGGAAAGAAAAATQLTLAMQRQFSLSSHESSLAASKVTPGNYIDYKDNVDDIDFGALPPPTPFNQRGGGGEVGGCVSGGGGNEGGGQQQPKRRRSLEEAFGYVGTETPGALHAQKPTSGCEIINSQQQQQHLVPKMEHQNCVQQGPLDAASACGRGDVAGSAPAVRGQFVSSFMKVREELFA